MGTRLVQGFRYALAGLRLAWRGELHFRIEIVCALAALSLGVFFRLSPVEFALVVASIALVLMAEAFNTALEELCDKFQATHDPHIERIKDLAAAAVLLASLGAFVIGLLVFIPHL